MRVKIGDTWYDSEETPICVEFSVEDKKSLATVLQDKAFSKYSAYPNSETRPQGEIYDWMCDGNLPKNIGAYYPQMVSTEPTEKE